MYAERVLILDDLLADLRANRKSDGTTSSRDVHAIRDRHVA